MSRKKRGASAPLYRKRLQEVTLYTDGSASHTSRHGGWAFVITFPPGKDGNEYEVEKSGHVTDTTNNAMELRAAIEGLKFLKQPRKVHLYSDSAYMINALVNKWWKEWERNGWVRKDGRQTPNAALWQELVQLCQFHLVELHKVKGHNGDPMNERCDKLAKQARKAGTMGLSPGEPKPQNTVSKRKTRPYTLALKKANLGTLRLPKKDV